MSVRRINPKLIKLHRTYSVVELARRLGVHKNSVRNWQTAGLQSIDTAKPFLFAGATVRAFHQKRNEDRKRPCPPGTLYCLCCGVPRAPALAMVEYVPLTPTAGNARAICEVCERVMCRRVRKSDLATVMPGCDVQIRPAETRLKSRP